MTEESETAGATPEHADAGEIARYTFRRSTLEKGQSVIVLPDRLRVEPVAGEPWEVA
jgi:hypothetical protein